MYKKLFARVFRNSQQNSADGSKVVNVITVKLQVLVKLEVVPTSEILQKKRFHCRSFPMNLAKSLRTAFCKKLKFRAATSEEVKNITSYPHDNLHQLSL